MRLPKGLEWVPERFAVSGGLQGLGIQDFHSSGLET